MLWAYIAVRGNIIKCIKDLIEQKVWVQAQQSRSLKKLEAREMSSQATTIADYDAQIEKKQKVHLLFQLYLAMRSVINTANLDYLPLLTQSQTAFVDASSSINVTSVSLTISTTQTISITDSTYSPAALQLRQIHQIIMYFCLKLFSNQALFYFTSCGYLNILKVKLINFKRIWK